ncbi:MAG TPA: hypothetical protein VHD95_05065 [Rhizomicrobium sp.]|jgi:hypothetical protein|nr:hypothetical protein [Rhizomicrobium sp.]
MRADRALPLLLAAVFAGFPTAACCQETAGWQDQRTVALQSPGRSMSMLRLLDRNHDVGRRETGDEVRLGHDVTIREGRAYLFTARSDDFPIARLSGAVDGKGLHLIVSWPP